MPKFRFAIVLCAGAATLMLLPLVVPVTFSKGITGRGSLLPSWFNAVTFYTIGAAIVVLCGREAKRDMRRRWSNTVLLRRAIITVRPNEQTERATIPADTRGTLHVRLLDVQTRGRHRFVGRVRLRGDPPHDLGDLVHDDGAPCTDFQADLPRIHMGVLEWHTIRVETESPTSDPILARVEVRLLVPSNPPRMQ